VAHVTKAEQHPNADKLRLCEVDCGDGKTHQVVCGAPNARTGMKGVFAPVGSYIPGLDMTLKAGKIRGEASNGMLVSEREMGLSDEHEGIIDLPKTAEVGKPFAEVMGLDDPVIEIGLTPNRPDCLGVRGIARDLAAAGLGTLKPLTRGAPVAGGHESPMAWRRDLPAGAEDACPYVAGRHFSGVKNGESPAWMQQRLTAIGLRPISALVDITNYVTFDLGRPLHVFDADKVSGDLTMRLAKTGEEVAALDERTYALDAETVVIADADRVHGIGGIMGGAESGVTEETTRVFLEVALFDPVRIAAAGRRLGIHSDARHRFERGVDPESADWGVHVATRLIQEICGGEASEVVCAGEIPQGTREVTLRPDRVEALGGVAVGKDTAATYLDRLGFAVRDDSNVLAATAPSWRPDVEGEADLVEEVLRIHGYDNIPVAPLEQLSPIPQPAVSPLQRRAEIARTTLAWQGLDEAVTFSFMSSRHADRFGGVADDLRLANPISSELDVMRPVALANLIEAAGRNADKGFPDLGLFEIGPQYRNSEPGGQDNVAAGLRAGRPHPRHWAEQDRPLDAFDAKADAEAVLAALEAPVERLQTVTPAPDRYHPGRSGVLCLGPKNPLAYFGELHPKVLDLFGLRGPVVAFEVFLDNLPKPKSKDGKTKPALSLSPFQPVERDFAFIVDADVAAEKVLRAARSANKDLVSEVSLFDVYQGDKMEAGKKSLALKVTLQPREQTLTDKDIEAVGQAIIDKVAKETGASLRG
jgi:phenylalanyl-tRNA synthetase beta chain